MLRGLLKITAVLVALIVLVGTALAWRGLGHGPDAARLARMQKSPQWRDGAFNNPQPLVNHFGDMLTGMFAVSDFATPKETPPTIASDAARFAALPASGLRVTWFGHSSTLIEIDGMRVLTDPVWSERVTPVSFVGPTRYYPPPLPMLALPKIDAVIVSHDHYDHLDEPTIVALKERTERFIVPLGVGAHLAYWGVAADRIIELDWWESVTIGAIEIACTPARHASGRAPWDKDETLWASYALVGPAHRVYYSGDTGLFPAMKTIGERYGPFDLTMIEVGQYHRAWPDWHIGPEQAIAAHAMLRGRVLLPIHWGLFTLAYHGWTEPAERAVAAAGEHGATILTPKPGESVDVSAWPAQAAWWPKVPWQTAAEHPIMSTQLE